MTTYPNGQIPTSALTGLSVGGYLLSGAAASFEMWRSQAAAAGRTLTITSAGDAYRSLERQVAVFQERYEARATGDGPFGDVRTWNGVRYVRMSGAAAAVPGTSNHGKGIAVDIANAGGFGGPFHNWLTSSGPALGWSNAEGASVNEPWHWVHLGSNPTTPTDPIPEDDMFTDTDRARLSAVYDAIFTGGTSTPAGMSLFARLEHHAQAAPAKAASAVWGTGVLRDGATVSAIQELADAKTAAKAGLSEVREMRTSQANEAWLTPVLGVEPATGTQVVKRAADWLTETAFNTAP